MRRGFLNRAGSYVAAVALFLAGGCDRGEVTGPESPQEPPPPVAVTASEWVGSVDWDQRTVVDVTMVESGAALAYSPNVLSFEAGKPYVLRIINPASNSSKHYFSPEGLESFYQAVATRKIQTAEAEYKAPYFDAVELKIGGSLEIFFVPVLAGSLTTDSRRSGSHEVWSAAEETTIAMFESQSAYGFVPPDINLSRDVGYKLTLDNPSGNSSKHYYTAADFYKTVVLRKADDTQAEIKAPYLKAVELLIEGSTTLFMVPTVDGVYDVLCTIPGHADLGMTGTVTVGEAPPGPVTSSEWVNSVNWNDKTVVDVYMVESGASLAFSPNSFTFEAGKPYVLRINNPEGNASKHYFSPEGLESFYQAVATRKIQTAEAEYKAPYFDAVELKIGGSLEIFFVPVLAGRRGKPARPGGGAGLRPSADH
jgi:uncharacterized cupredoxin-like copper-binding protein